MHWLIGTILGTPGPAQVHLVPARDWQEALVGRIPPRAFNTRTAWKALVRRRVELALQARDMAWSDRGADPGGHRFDALGLTLYLQDQLARARALHATRRDGHARPR
jgi:hypothetical protein